MTAALARVAGSPRRRARSPRSRASATTASCASACAGSKPAARGPPTGSSWPRASGRPIPRAGDAGAALAIAREGLARFPGDAGLTLGAADAARRLGRSALAIRLYEHGLAGRPRDAEAVAALGRLRVERLSALVLSDRPAAAARVLRAFRAFHARATAALGQAVEPDLADAEAAFGRGLASIGEIDRARGTLLGSIDCRPTLDALESLGTLALKQDRFDEAIAAFDRAVERPATEPLARAQQCRVLRLSAEAYEGEVVPPSRTRGPAPPCWAGASSWRAPASPGSWPATRWSSRAASFGCSASSTPPGRPLTRRLTSPPTTPRSTPTWSRSSSCAASTIARWTPITARSAAARLATTSRSTCRCG